MPMKIPGMHKNHSWQEFSHSHAKTNEFPALAFCCSSSSCIWYYCDQFLRHSSSFWQLTVLCGCLLYNLVLISLSITLRHLLFINAMSCWHIFLLLAIKPYCISNCQMCNAIKAPKVGICNKRQISQSKNGQFTKGNIYYFGETLELG